MMKKELYILSLLCFLSLTIFAQEKVKIGGDTYYYKNFSVSAYPELDNIIDIQSNFIIEKDVPVAVDNLKKSFFQIKGFLKSKDATTPLSIETTISQPHLLDKAIMLGKGNNYNCLFTFGCTVKVVVAIKNKIIFNEVLKKSVTVLDRRYFLTQIDAQNRLEELIAKQELGDQEEEAIYETLELIRKELENVMGYLPNQEYIRFFYLKNKDNSEYERIFAFRELVKKEMLSITPEKGISLINF